jgi:hypothetical protein
MAKVFEKPESTKVVEQAVHCFSCNAKIDKDSTERRRYYRFQFCNTECLEDFTRKFS